MTKWLSCGPSTTLKIAGIAGGGFGVGHTPNNFGVVVGGQVGDGPGGGTGDGLFGVIKLVPAVEPCTPFAGSWQGCYSASSPGEEHQQQRRQHQVQHFLW